jgi:hypothetical protein
MMEDMGGNDEGEEEDEYYYRSRGRRFRDQH